MSATSVVGLDTAKNVFRLYGVDRDGKVTFKKRLRRAHLTDFFANLSPCVIGIGSNTRSSPLGAYSGNIRAHSTSGTTKIYVPEEGNSYPMLRVVWEEEQFNLTVAQWDQQLRDSHPRIEVLTNSNPSLVPAVREDDDPKHEAPKNQLEIASMTLQDGEDLMVGRRLREILNTARTVARTAS